MKECVVADEKVARSIENLEEKTCRGLRKRLQKTLLEQTEEIYKNCEDILLKNFICT
jgi:hypothetical protein